MDKKDFEYIIKNALAEDIGSGDITTSAIVPANLIATGEFLAKQNGIVAGLDVVEILLGIVDSSLSFERKVSEGEKVNAGKIIAAVKGSAASMLTAERTALNFLQRMSGIATMTNLYIERIKHTKAKILDTRKTAPGLRELDKLAVKLGGGTNHRIGLYDMFLIKDNHIAAAGSIIKAIESCKEYRRKNNSSYKIEVETENLEQVKEALNTGADFILLDNFEPVEMRKAVQLISGKCLTEASGGIDLNTIKAVAETGVDYISVGALTHSVRALDISLEITI